MILTADEGKASTQNPSKKKSNYNPLDALLKEKRAAERGGNGEDDLRRAEGALTDEVDDLGEWGNEAAALAAVKDGRWIEDQLASYAGPSTDSVLDEQDRKRLLGEKRGRAVGVLLDSDKAKDIEAREGEKTPGVPLWIETDADSAAMEASTTITAPDLGDRPILRRLRDAINDGGGWLATTPPLMLTCFSLYASVPHHGFRHTCKHSDSRISYSISLNSW